jgi:anti-sigma B factor antagonist
MDQFSMQRKEMDDLTVLYIEGYLDAHTAHQFEEALRKIIEEGRYKIVVNFSRLNYISSAGLGVFMGVIEEVRSNGGDIKMCCLSDKVFRVFDLLGFPALYDIVKTEDEAIQKFRDAQEKAPE